MPALYALGRERPKRGEVLREAERRAQAAVSGPYRVAGWTLTLAGRDRAPEPMSVRMMARQW